MFQTLVLTILLNKLQDYCFTHLVQLALLKILNFE